LLTSSSDISMPHFPARRLDYIPLKLRSVSMSELPAPPKVPQHNTAPMQGNEAAQIPLPPAPQRAGRPLYRDINALRPGFGAAADDAEHRVFTSWPAGSQPPEDEQADAVHEDTLPRTRYRFGATVPGCRDPGPPPNPSLARSLNAPVAVASAAVLLRQLTRNMRMLVAMHAGRPSQPAASVAAANLPRPTSDSHPTPAVPLSEEDVARGPRGTDPSPQPTATTGGGGFQPGPAPDAATEAD
jgi:hypothetical protein